LDAAESHTSLGTISTDRPIISIEMTSWDLDPTRWSTFDARQGSAHYPGPVFFQLHRLALRAAEDRGTG